MPLTTSDLRPHCDICGRTEEYAGVAAVPGAPVSISWCHPCIRNNAQPMFCLQAVIAIGDDDSSTWSLEDSIARAKDMGMEPDLELAQWFLDSTVYVDGDYVPIREYLRKIYDAA